MDVSEEEKAARVFAIEFNQEMEEDRARAAVANWNYMTNLTAENSAIYNVELARLGVKQKVTTKSTVLFSIQGDCGNFSYSKFYCLPHRDGS